MRNPKIEVYLGKRNFGTGRFQWYWRCIASNGRIVCDGSEGYVSKSNAVRAAKRAAALMWYCARTEALRVEVVDE